MARARMHLDLYGGGVPLCGATRWKLLTSFWLEFTCEKCLAILHARIMNDPLDD